MRIAGSSDATLHARAAGDAWHGIDLVPGKLAASSRGAPPVRNRVAKAARSA
jgi:hypothetical protein